MPKQTRATKIIKRPKIKNTRAHYGPFIKEGKLNESYMSLSNGFTYDDLHYIAGMIDGDGHISMNKGGTLKLELELKETDAYPVAYLADLMDTAVTLSVRPGDHKTLRTAAYGSKAWMMLCMLFPYLFERKSKARTFLKRKFRNVDCFHLANKFNFAYLAGYADAEGHFKKGTRYVPSENRTRLFFGFELTSTHEQQIRFISMNLRQAGFPVTTTFYHNNRLRKDGGRCKDTYKIHLHDLRSLRRLYNLLLPHCKIQRKAQIMRDTLTYIDYFSKFSDDDKINTMFNKNRKKTFDEHKEEDSI